MKGNSSRLSGAAEHVPVSRAAGGAKASWRLSDNKTFPLDIAVVGMACRLPGADDYREFWKNLCEGTVSVSEIPADRWDRDAVYGDPGERNRSQSKWGGFLADAARFDAGFFGISPREAERMDPQQRFMLELAWQCIEDAGYAPPELAGRDIGVFIGASIYDYKELQEQRFPEVEGHTSTGVYNSIIPNRVSYFFNFHGPSMVVDTACSSSLVAIHQAIGAIRAGECEAALAGGVSLLATPTSFISFGKAGMLSATGACNSFDESADGYVRGEGGALILLKPLAQALADEDDIWGVIKGSAVNHGGRARSLTAPNALLQSKVIGAALRQSGVAPSTVGYVETHGTGTPLGDPIEVHGLTRAFQQAARHGGDSLGRHTCGLGAVKSNIGHLEAGAGIASVVKVLLALKNETLPCNPQFRKLNPRIDLDDSPFYVLQRTDRWRRQRAADGSAVPLRAGVSSFGFGGANGHLVIEEAPSHASSVPAAAPGECLLTVSAQSEASLKALARHYANFLQDRPEALADICREAQTTRAHLGRRLSVVAASSAQAFEALRAYAADGTLREGVKHYAPPAEAPRVGFLFTGQGAQYVGMGKELYTLQPVFRAALNRCDAALQPYLGRSIIETMFDGDAGELGRTRHTQPALFAIEYALSEMWKSFGVTPDMVIGHSVGEIVAACVAGVFSLEDAARLIARRGHWMDSVDAAGTMAAVYVGREALERFLREHDLALDIAADNAPDSTVVSGERVLVERALGLFAQAGIETKPLEVSQAFHSALMEPILAAFGDDIRGIKFSKPTLPLISNVTGARAGEEILDPQYWVDHIRRPVLFRQGIESAHAAGVRTFLEIGPAPMLTALARRSLPGQTHGVASLSPKLRDSSSLVVALSECYALGLALDFSPLHSSSPRRLRLRLPQYPFTGERYWPAPQEHRVDVPALTGLLSTDMHPLLGRRLSLAVSDAVYFTSHLSCDELAYLNDHRIHGEAVLPGAAYIELALAAMRRVGGAGAGAVEDAVFHRPLFLREDVLLQTVLKLAERPGAYRFEVWSCLPVGANGQAPWQLHATGLVGPGEPGAQTWRQMSRAALTVARVVNPADLYPAMTGHGLEYGPDFQGVHSLHAHEDHGVAEVSLPAALADAHEGYLCHPVLLDAIFQSALPLLPADAFRNGLLPLPVAVERLWLRGPLPQHVRVEVSLGATEGDGDGYRCHYCIHASDGTLLGEVTGLTLKRVSFAAASSVANDAHASADFHYQPSWRRQPPLGRPVGAPIGSVGGVLLLYAPQARALADAIARRMPERSPALIGIEPAHNADASTYARMLDAHTNIDEIYFLGGCHPHDESVDPDAAFLEDAQQRGVLALFQLIKALDADVRRERPIALKVVTAHSYAVIDGDPVTPWGAATHGVASVYGNERATLRLLNIDVDLDSNAASVHLDDIATRIVMEPAVEQGGIVALRRADRYCRVLEPVVLPSSPESVYRSGGVYLILGGAGGVGLAWSRHLAQNYGAKLIWVGRSALDEAKQQAIAEIARLGGEAVYFQADGGDVDAMTRVVAEATRRFGRLNGAVHSALVLRDQSLQRMDLATFREGLDPKVRGAWALWQAVQREPLDFLMFFSSVVAFLPNRGQANYVAGCAFKDAFAHYLRQRHAAPVKIINWGRWSGVGAVASEEYEQRLSAQGIHSIHPPEGIGTIAAVAASPATQIAALKADPAMLRRIGVDLSVEARWLSPRVELKVEDWMQQPAPALELPAERDRVLASYGALNRFAVELLQRVMGDLNGDKPLDAAVLKAQLGIVGSYERLYRAALDMLGEAGVWQVENDRITTKADSRPLSWAVLTEAKDDLVDASPWLRPEAELLWECARHLGRILRGEVPATQIIFPNLSMSLVEGVYSSGLLARYYNGRVADAVAGAIVALPAGKVRILEVGAGTGGTSRVVLERLRRAGIEPGRIEYIYTDVSSAFLQHGREHVGQDAFLRFATLDIEKPVEAQGFEVGGCDIVFASNVLHATRDLTRTLQHTKSLLKQGGTLILHELVQRQNFLTLTFGMLDGWWLADDPHKRVAHAPVLTAAMWCQVLQEEGFPVALELHADAAAHDANYLGVIVARSDGRVRAAKQRSPSVSGAASVVKSAPVRRAPRTSGADLVTLSRTASSEVLRGGLLDYMRGELADVLHLRQEQLDGAARPLPQMLLSELGVDSLTAMDLRNRLRKQLAVEMPVEKLLGGSSVQTVADLVQEQLLLNRLMGGGDAAAAADGVSPSAGNDDMETFVL